MLPGVEKGIVNVQIKHYTIIAYTLLCATGLSRSCRLMWLDATDQGEAMVTQLETAFLGGEPQRSFASAAASCARAIAVSACSKAKLESLAAHESSKGEDSYVLPGVSLGTEIGEGLGLSSPKAQTTSRT